MVDEPLELVLSSSSHPEEEVAAVTTPVASEVLIGGSKEEEDNTIVATEDPMNQQHKKLRFKSKELQQSYWDRSSEEMDVTRALRIGRRYSGSMQSEESVLDREQTFVTGNSSRHPRTDGSPLQASASAGQHSESRAYFLWPASNRLNGTAEERAAYFGGVQKEVDSDTLERLPSGQQATTLLDLMTIRAFHSKILRRYSLGTAIGFRIREGVLTNIPAILVFVARKVHKQWLLDIQRLPSALQGPGGVWCDVDVVEFSYYGAPAATPKEQLYTELVEGLRGSDPTIGSGSQVASQETYGTLGAIVRSRTGSRQVGFLTNRHVAVDLDYPNQKMFHPLPPNLGPGVYLGAVERATSFNTDDLWYGIFAGMNPETFVRADGAFIPFAESFDISKVTTTVKGVGDVGDVMFVDLQKPIGSLIGKQVVKVGRSSGLTRGTVMAYALEYNDEKGICFFTDFLVVGENKQAFDLEGDSGSLILITGENGEKPRPVGIIWGGTANRGSYLPNLFVTIILIEFGVQIQYLMMKRHVGVGIDFSASSEYALHWALSNLARHGDTVFLIHVNSDLEYGEGALWMEEGAPLVPLKEIDNQSIMLKYGIKLSIDILQQLKSAASHKDLTVALKVYWGDARAKLCRAEVDLELHCLVVGSRGMGMLKRAILGSVSEYVVSNAACPVTVIKTPQQCLELEEDK